MTSAVLRAIKSSVVSKSTAELSDRAICRKAWVIGGAVWGMGMGKG